MLRKFNLNQIKKVYQEFPPQFWTVVGVSFIDGVGGTMLYPFFALYITQKFNVGMTQAGMILGFFSLFGMIGSMIGGALTDKYGRRSLILFGLIFSAITTLALGFVSEFWMLFPLAVVIGLLSNVAGPAQQAMIADLLPEKQRAEGFGILRVVGNLAWIIGPTIGGLVANHSFFYLFVSDAVISCIVAALFYKLIPETKPTPAEGEQPEAIGQTFVGYLKVLRDGPFIAFMAAGVIALFVYQQMYNTLSVYLRDNHGIDPQGYGFLMSTSAVTVILFQFWTTRRIKDKPPFLIMGLGTLFYALGFGLFGLVSTFWLFALNIVIITIGEMIIMPTSQALAANFAPEDMRGRYMAVFGMTWGLPAIISPGLAGVIIDNYNPNLLWYLGAVLCTISALGYYLLHARIGKQKRFAPPPVPEEIVTA